MMTSKEGLRKLAESEGLEELDMYEQAMMDSVAPGVCLVCGYTCTVEPDQAHGYCEGCGGQTVQSCLMLAGLI